MDRTLLRLQNARFYPKCRKISAWMQQHMPSTSGVSLTPFTMNFSHVNLFTHKIYRPRLGDVHNRRSADDLGIYPAYWSMRRIRRNSKKNRWGPTNVPGSLSANRNRATTTRRKTGTDPSQIAFLCRVRVSNLRNRSAKFITASHQGLTKDEHALHPCRCHPHMLLRASLHTARHWANLALTGWLRFGTCKLRIQIQRLTNNSARSTPQRRLASRTARIRSLQPYTASTESESSFKRAAPHATGFWNRSVPRQEIAPIHP